MIVDYFKLAFKNLMKRKLRSWLTMIGIFISVATIFILISLSLGLKAAVAEQFRLLGADKFFIMPRGQLGAPGTGGAVQLTLDDVNIVEKVQGVKDVSYVVAGNAKIEFDNKIRYYSVLGLPADKSEVFKEISAYKEDEGRFLKTSDKDNYYVMIGSMFKYNNIFPRPVKNNDKLLINGKEFKVIGILQPLGNPSDDSLIYMSLDIFKVLFKTSNRVDQIFVQINPGEDITKISSDVKRKLLRFRDLTEKTRDFEILTPEDLLSSFDVILNIVTAFLIGIAAISLLVGAIGIANTMYTSVLERTREIGTMKAVGAKNSDILFLFLIESGLLGLMGGIVGVVLGILISKSIELYAIKSLGTTLLRAATPLYLIIGCLLFAFIIGAISGVWPAWRAIKVKPVDALRYE